MKHPVSGFVNRERAFFKLWLTTRTLRRTLAPMITKTLRLVILAFGVVFFAGCKTVAYNPSFIRPVAQSVEPRYPGKLLILTTPSDDQFVFRGRPHSLTGVAWKLKVPFGEITKKASGEIYGHLFQSGYEFGRVPNPNRFVVTIKPKIEDFAWRMNQLKNVGFAITPQIKMTLDVELLAADQSVLLRRQYESGWVDGNSYVLNLSPFDAVSLVIHKTMANLMVDSIRDWDAVLRPNASPQPLPGSFSTKDEGMAASMDFWSTWSAAMAARSNPGPARNQPWDYSPSPFPQPVYTGDSVIETRIDGDFNGWEGNNAWVMENGQIWRQAQYSYHYYYAYHPKVIIFPSNNQWVMHVDGVDTLLQVQRIK